MKFGNIWSTKVTIQDSTSCIIYTIYNLRQLTYKSIIVEALQFPSNTQSHWSSGVNGLLPRDAQTHNGTGFLMLALSRNIGDPDMIDHWPYPRLRADNGKLN